MDDAMQMILTEVDQDAGDAQSNVMQNIRAQRAVATTEQVSGAAHSGQLAAEWSDSDQRTLCT